MCYSSVQLCLNKSEHMGKIHDVTDDGRTVFQLRTFNLRETPAQAHVPLVSGMSQSCAVDVLNQLRESLGKEGQVHFVPDVVLRPLEQVQQGLQERPQL